MRSVHAMVAALSLLYASPGISATTLTVRDWPEARPCAHCVLMQFGTLELRMPAALVGRVYVAPNGPPGMHLLPSPDPRRALLLFAVSRAEMIGKYGVDSTSVTAREFFDSLVNVEGYAVARKAEGVEKAVRYTRTTRGASADAPGVAAYLIEARAGETQTLHIAIDGDDLIYTLAGDISAPVYSAVLSRLRIVPEP